MKKTLLFFLVLIMFSTMTMARRLDNPKVLSSVAVMKSGSAYKLIYKSNTKANVKVAIYDADHKLVFAETIRKTEGFVRPYNFSKLAEGDYVIEVIDESGTLSEHVNYAEPKSERMAGLVHYKDGKYLLTLPSKKNEQVTIKIFGDQDQLVYNKRETLQGDFSQLFDLSYLNGKFSIEITDSTGQTKVLTY